MIKFNLYGMVIVPSAGTISFRKHLSQHSQMPRASQFIGKVYGARFELIDLEICAQLDLKSLDSQRWFCPIIHYRGDDWHSGICHHKCHEAQ